MKTKRAFALLTVLVLLAVSLPLAALAETYATVTSFDVLHLRDLPGTDGNIIGKYRRGTRVEILYTGFRNWVRVRTPDGKVGYMYKNYLSAFKTTGSSSSSSSSSSGSWTGTSTRYIKSKIGPVNFRSKASVTSQLLDQLPGGTKVTLLTEGVTWSRVKYNGTLGWIKTKYLVKNKGE